MAARMGLSSSRVRSSSESPRSRTSRFFRCGACGRGLGHAAGLIFAACALWLATSAAYPQTQAASQSFQNWLQQLWPAAQALGVSRATFDAATRGLEPDLSLPDLVIPGRPDGQPAQAE